MEDKLREQINGNSVVLFGRQNSIEMLDIASQLIKIRKKKILLVHIDENGQEETSAYLHLFRKIYGTTQLPILFLNQQYIGGIDQIQALFKGKKRTLKNILKDKFEYDLCIIGGGTCGVQAAIDASKDVKVALIDMNVDTMKENQIGLGDGSKLVTELLPKYFLHRKLSFLKKNEKINTHTIWNELMSTLRQKMSNIIANRKKEIEESSNIRYYPGRAVLKDSHTVIIIKSDSSSTQITAKNILIATGTQLSLDDTIKGYQLGITTDQLFQMNKPPGKTLIIGDSLKCLEMGGILGKMGIFCTVMATGNFDDDYKDEDLMSQVTKISEVCGVKFLTNYKIKSLVQENVHIVVNALNNMGQDFELRYNTVLFTRKRRGRTNDLGLDQVGLSVDKNSRKIHCNSNGTTVNTSILVTGSIMDCPYSCFDNVTHTQHTMNLIRGYRTNSIISINTKMVPRIALTPMEYGAVGESEKSAIHKFGKQSIRVYEATHGDVYAKLVCMKDMNERILGIHVLAPRVADLMQSFVTCMIIGIGKNDVNIFQFTEKKRKNTIN